METIKAILETGMYLQWIAVAMFIVGGTGLLLRGFKKKDNRPVVLGLAIGMAPLLVPIAIKTVQEVQRHARRAAVAATPREALAADYPHQLLIRAICSGMTLHD